MTILMASDCTGLPLRIAFLLRYELLYRKGQPCNAFYIVLSGAIHLTVNEWGAKTSADGAPSAAAAAVSGAAASGHKMSIFPRVLTDVQTGKALGLDAGIYEDSTLGPGSVFGIETLALITNVSTEGGDQGKPASATPATPATPASSASSGSPGSTAGGAGGMLRAHTATSIEAAVLLVLPEALLAQSRRIYEQLIQFQTARRAEIMLCQQALVRAPVFSEIAPRRLVPLAQTFRMRAYAPGDKLTEEGRPIETFHVVVSGKLVFSQRTGWGKLRLFQRAGRMQTEKIVATLTHETHTPFVGESVLDDVYGVVLGAQPAATALKTSGGGVGKGGAQEPISAVAVRAADHTCVLCLAREDAEGFARALPEFAELVHQRRHRLLHQSMHDIALQQARAKHQEEAMSGRPPELQEALDFARSRRRPHLERWTPKPPPPVHEHAVPVGFDGVQRVPARERKGIAEQSRKIMLNGMEVHRVALKMGLAGDAALKPQADHAAGGARAAGQVAMNQGHVGAGGAITKPDKATERLMGKLKANRQSLTEIGPPDGSLSKAQQEESQGAVFLAAMSELEMARKVLSAAS